MNYRNTPYFVIAVVAAESIIAVTAVIATELYTKVIAIAIATAIATATGIIAGITYQKKTRSD